MASWTRDSTLQALSSIGIQPVQERDIDHALQFILSGGTKVNCFNSGKVQVQGPATDEKNRVEALFKTSPANVTPRSSVPFTPSTTQSTIIVPAPVVVSTVQTAVPAQSNIFIVYGHDTKARDELELLLLRLKIQPIILANLAPDGKTIIEALMAASDVSYAVILLTPDDEAHPANKPDEKKFRARQNVVLELGMFLMKLGRERVAILYKGTLERPSDIDGLIYIAFKNSVAEAKNKLAAALQKAGFFIDIEALSAE